MGFPFWRGERLRVFASGYDPIKCLGKCSLHHYYYCMIDYLDYVSFHSFVCLETEGGL